MQGQHQQTRPSAGQRLQQAQQHQLISNRPSFYSPTIPSQIRRVKAQAQTEKVSQFDALNRGIAKFYNESSDLWIDTWGEHMHHGYYEPDDPNQTDEEAQINMIEKALSFAGVSKVESMVDVGCGVGGSSRYISKKFGCSGDGISLSEQQVQLANQLTAQAGLGDRLKFQVGDALKQPFESNQFDLVWSMESGEHMPDKRGFVEELVRVAKPDGTIIIVTWCHRELQPNQQGLESAELQLLDTISEAYYLPKWCSSADYAQIFSSMGITDVKVSDWTLAVAPFWGRVIQTSLTLKGIIGLFKAGWGTIKGALAMPLMKQGMEQGLIKFIIITGKAPK